MTDMETYAINELTRIGMYGSGDKMNDMMCEHILKMVNVFAEEGHSGFSASYATNILQKLLRFEPLSPLTGEDDEWCEVTDDLYQNKRLSTVFKEGKDGQAYNIDGKVFVEPDGCAYTSRDSHVYIEFPYVPHTEYVKVEKLMIKMTHEEWSGKNPMKVFIVIENFDSGHGYASYNIGKIFLSEQKAIEWKNKLIKRYEELCNVKYEELPIYEQPFEVIPWEVEE